MGSKVLGVVVWVRLPLGPGGLPRLRLPGRHLLMFSRMALILKCFMGLALGDELLPAERGSELDMTMGP